MSQSYTRGLHSCQYCGKLVASKFRRVCCEKHSPLGEALWVEFYGPEGWIAQSRCIGAADDEFCTVPFQPNGGFVCQQCFNALCDPVN